MYYREISRVLGIYLFYLSLILCIPLGVAIYFEYVVETHLNPQPDSSLEFFITLLLSLSASFLFYLFGKGAKGALHRRESILLVFVIWLVSAAIGALPFYLTKTLTNPLDAFFETISGFTTTGASLMVPKAYSAETGEEIPIEVYNLQLYSGTYQYYGTIEPVKDETTGEVLFTGVEAVGKAVLFWRSLTQWLGGMGIVVLFLTVLPALGVGGKSLYHLETTGPIKDSISPRIKETASLLWKLYLGLSFVEVLLLLWTNPDMPLFDAVNITLTNISTGGFSIKNDSIGSYHNPHTEWIVILFMLIGSTNFALFFHILKGRFYKIYAPDFFLFITSIVGGGLFVTYFLFQSPLELFYPIDHASWGNTIRTGIFQAISAQTTTGFGTANYNYWVFPAQMGLLLVMFIGGMAGSTSGGIKTPRFYILFQIIRHQIGLIFRPDQVRILKIEETAISHTTAITVTTFFSIVFFSTILGTVLYVLDGIDPETALGLMACMVNNIGMAFQAAGPGNNESFAILSPLSKLLSCFWMLLGRLEYYTVLILFLPSFWKAK